MRKSIKRFTSVLLSAAMVSSFAFGITGCNKSTDSSGASSAVSTDSNIEDNGTEAQADAVEYSSNGVYTTTLKLENGGFDGITADDVQIAYVSEQPEKSDETASGTESGTDGENGAKYAEVLETTVNSDGSLSVTFEDKDAAAQKTQYYVVLIEKISVGAAVNVNFKEHNLTCDKDYVLSTDNAVKLTFTLDEGEYAQDVTKDDISLAGSFENMSVDSVSAAGKNLTMQLSGDIAFLESSNAYLDGVVTVSSDAVQDSILPLEAHVPVNTQGVYFDVEKLEAADNKITVPLVLVGTADITALTPDDISFDGADITVESVSIIGDDEVSVVLNADGAVDKNSAAAILENSAVKVLDSDLVTGFTSASFYPVFDYVDEKDGNFEITVEIYANNGEFADGLSASSVSFGGDFDGAAATSLTRTSDTTAELIFTIPTNGQNTETIDLDGEIILSGGALINRWGDAKTEETSYTRNYSAENLGRTISANGASALLDNAAKVGEKLSNVVGGALTAYDAISTILDMTGIVPSTESQILSLVQDIKKQLDEIETMLGEQTKILKDISKNNLLSQLNSFEGCLSKMTSACNTLDRYLAEASEHVEKPTDKSDQSYQAYATELMKYCKENSSEYFTKTINELYDNFSNATTMLAYTNLNPLSVYDTLCANSYNFETQTIELRRNYRTYVEYTTGRGLSYLILYYCFCNNDVNAGMSLVNEHYVPAMKQFNKYRDVVDTRPSGYSYCYALGRNLSLTGWEKITVPDIDDWGEEVRAVHGKGTYTDFTKAQREEFVNRMQGHTLREDLISGGFSGFDKNGRGMAFWVERQTQPSKWYEKVWALAYKSDYKDYYAYVMDWDTQKMEYVRIANGGGDYYDPPNNYDLLPNRNYAASYYV